MTITAPTPARIEPHGLEDLENLRDRVDTALVNYAGYKIARAVHHAEQAVEARKQAVAAVIRIVADRAYLAGRDAASLPMRPRGDEHPVLVAHGDYAPDLAALFDAQITFGELFHVLPCEAFSRDEHGTVVTFDVAAVRAEL